MTVLLGMRAALHLEMKEACSVAKTEQAFLFSDHLKPL